MEVLQVFFQGLTFSLHGVIPGEFFVPILSLGLSSDRSLKLPGAPDVQLWLLSIETRRFKTGLFVAQQHANGDGCLPARLAACSGCMSPTACRKTRPSRK